jgi:hypothetical protein
MMTNQATNIAYYIYRLCVLIVKSAYKESLYSRKYYNHFIKVSLWHLNKYPQCCQVLVVPIQKYLKDEDIPALN